MKYLYLILIVFSNLFLSCNNSSGTISKYNPDTFLDEKNKNKLLFQISKNVFDPGYNHYIQEDEEGNQKRYEVDSTFFKNMDIKFDSYFVRDEEEDSEFSYFIYYPHRGWFAKIFNGSGGSFTIDSNFNIVNIQKVFIIEGHEGEEEFQRKGREAFEVMINGGDMEELIKEKKHLYSPDVFKDIL